MSELHSLLARQLRRLYGKGFEIPAPWNKLVEAVDEAYREADSDRRMLERALELSSRELLETNSKLRGIVEAFPDLFLHLDAAGTIRDCTASDDVDLYAGRAELIGKKVHDIPIPEVAAAFREALEELEAGQATARVEYSFGDPDEHSYEARIVPLVGGDRLAVIRNISERRHAERELEESLSLLQATLDSTADGMLVVDEAGRISAFNSRFREMWNVPVEHLEARDDEAAIASVLSQLVDPDAFVAKVRELYASPEASSSDTLEFKDGRVFERFSQPQRIGGRTIGRVWSFRDITEQRRAEEAIRYHAYFDDLTGLPNRVQFNQTLASALARARNESRLLGLLFVDLDRFKTINDTLGHATGDLLLRAVAQRIQKQVRAGDAVARLGGDEFVILQDGLPSHEAALGLAERLLESFSAPLDVQGRELYISASIGVCIFPEHGEDAGTLTKHADLAMYRAKELGRNRVQFFEPQMTDAAVGRMVLESDLRRALEDGDVLVHFQPQFDLSRDEIVAAEALARIRSSGEILSPAEFIPLAEESGLIVPLEQEVVRQACRHAASWHEQGRSDVTVALNISALHLQLKTFADFVLAEIAAVGLEPGDVEIELTESALIRNLELGTRNLERLSEAGVRIALDDFGTGHSQLSYLKRLPIDTLKIDQSFVRHCDVPEGEESMVAAIIAMAHSLGVRVVAEGVERQAEADVLVEHGCDLVQGYLFSHPLEPRVLARLLDGALRAEA